jgi:hypothetical protein
MSAVAAVGADVGVGAGVLVAAGAVVPGAAAVDVGAVAADWLGAPPQESPSASKALKTTGRRMADLLTTLLRAGTRPG